MASPGALQSENYPVSSGFKIKVLPVKTQHLTSTSEKTTCPSNRLHWSWGSCLPFCARQSCKARAELVWQPTLPARLPAPPQAQQFSGLLGMAPALALQLTLSTGHLGALVGATHLEGAVHGVPSTPGRTSQLCQHPGASAERIRVACPS